MLGGLADVTPSVLEAYDKPEALVTLMDWSLAKLENHLFMTYGQAGEDYKRVDGNRLEPLGDPFDRFTTLFNASRKYPLPLLGGESPELPAACQQAAAKAATARGQADWVRLPQSAARYAVPGSALANALNRLPVSHRVCLDLMADRVAAGLAWETLEDPPAEGDETRMSAGMKVWDEAYGPYLALLQRWLDGAYDPAEDMTAPAK